MLRAAVQSSRALPPALLASHRPGPGSTPVASGARLTATQRQLRVVRAAPGVDGTLVGR
ncbi:hypothetical protein GCM10023235_14080 [Kitasatospora terrestris]|uniref:Uncharacterized protein n=1 Tax=Kitasatospora terrestris TaxID=258051 RepID=A0ABP9DJJ2_9ACTN